MIQIEALEFSYGNEFSLRVPRLAIGPGERVAVIGPSGSGKTTLLHLIAGISVADAGRIRVGDALVSELEDGARRNLRAAQIGLVFQEFELIEYLSLIDNVLLSYRINRSLRLERDVRQRAARLVERVGLGDKLQRRPGQLSHGERQRVALCRALVTQPKLVLADEPTGNLDPVNKHRVLDILLNYSKESGAALLTVTHDHELLPAFERVIDLADLHGAGSG